MKTLGKLLMAGLLTVAAMQALAGVTQANDPHANTPHDSGDGCGCGTSNGMPVYSFKSLLAGLNIRDTPIGYTPPLGPKVYTTITYNERETLQPAVFDAFNVGPKWTLNWLSWIQDNPASPGSQVLRYVAGGGGWDYSGYNTTTGAFSPEPDNGAVLVMTSRSPVTYELRFADGRKDIFATPDGAASYPRKVLLTEIVDAQGNTLTLNYDNQRRLSTITDAIGQLTAFAYSDSADPLLVTRITDPYGRQSTLSYDSQGRLISITDVIGMTSTFAYDSGTFIKAMTTPYGTTTFAHTEGANGNSTELSIQATDPDGHTERTEYLPGAPGVPFSVAQAPSGMTTFNAYLNYRDSYYWDKEAFAAACTVSGGSTSCDYNKARLKHFEHVNPCCYYTSRVLENVKYPLEGMIWYDYAGQAAPYYPGTLYKPSHVGRVLSDGSSQITRYTYNTYGLVTQKVDPAGRVTVYTYAPNGIDLRQVQQKVATGFDTLANYTYNSQHEPLTSTDAAGATTTYTYNDHGQRTSVTDALGETTGYQYDGNGFLTAVIDPLGHVERRFTYDAYGRVATDTDTEGYTRHFQYDNLDRLIRVTYPDGTSTSYAWNRLDLASVTDRQGNTTRYSYDAERNLIAVTDPLGHATSYTYYPNGKRHTMTDPNGNMTTWKRDLEGRVIAKTYADGKGTTYSYDNSSRLASTTDALGQTTAYRYSRADLLTGVEYAHAIHPTAAVTYAYDPYYPRLVSLSDGLGSTNFSYVPTGQPGALKLAAESGPFGANDTVRYGYDALGRIRQRSTDVETDYTYGPLGRLRQESSPLGTFHYGYLGDTNQLTTRGLSTPSGYPGLALSADYDSNLGDRQLRRLAYRAGGHRLAAMLTYTHSPEHLLTSAMTLAPWMPGWRRHDGDHDEGSAEARGTYHGHRSDDAGNHDGSDRDGWSHGNAGRGDVQRYGYDLAYRLTAVRGHGQRIGFDYDAADNLMRATGTASPFTATANALNQLATVNNQAWQYDADGHLRDDGTRQYSWDASGRLIAVTDLATGRVTAYRYDGLGRRLEISSQGGGNAPTDTRYLWCGLSICQAQDGNDTVTADYFDQGEVHGTAALYYLRDQLGSVIGVTDASGNKVLGTTRYGAYGTVENARGVQSDFGYAGMLRDPTTSLYLTKYREYDPAVGRWLSRDPIGERGGENLYGYVSNSPLTFYDPYGLWAWGDPLPQWLVDGSAGLGDGVSFGLTNVIRNAMGTNDVVNKCSGFYVGGEIAGVALDTAIGGAAGWEAAGERGAGKEFSHWIPNRMGGPRSLWNGNYVTTAEHALSDPYRYRFMARAWKELNPLSSRIYQQWFRIPNVYKGAAAAAAASGTAAAINSSCGCN